MGVDFEAAEGLRRGGAMMSKGLAPLACNQSRACFSMERQCMAPPHSMI